MINKTLEGKMQDIESASIMFKDFSDILDSKNSSCEKNMLSAMAMFRYSSRERNALITRIISRKKAI